MKILVETAKTEKERWMPDLEVINTCLVVVAVITVLVVVLLFVIVLVVLMISYTFHGMVLSLTFSLIFLFSSPLSCFPS